MADTRPNQEPERLLTGYAGRILLLITGGESIISIGGMLLPPLLPAIIVDLGITPTQAGLVMTVWWLSVAFHNVPGGRLADQLSHKTVIVGGLVFSVLGLIILTASVTYPLLLAGVAVLGIGRGLYQPAAITQIAKVFVSRRGQAFGIRNAAFNVGGTAAGGIAVVVLAIGTWRIAFWPVVVALAIVLVLMHWWNREPYVLSRVTLDVRGTGGRVLRSGRIRWIIVVLSLYGFAWNGATSFLPAYLHVEKEFAASTAGIAFSGLFLVGAIVQPFAGTIGDRIGHPYAAAGAAVLSSIGLGTLVLAGSPPVVAVGLAVFAAGLASFWPVMTAHGMDSISGDSRGGDWGAVTAIFLVVESLGSTYVGVVIERLGYDVAYASLIVCFVSAVGITLWLAGSRTDTRSVHITQ